MSERLGFGQATTGVRQVERSKELTLLFMSLLLNKGECLELLLEILDQFLQLLLFASRYVCLELVLGDLFEVSNCFFLGSFEEAAVVCIPEVLATAR